jgi:PPOX class probable F420-dependent enzyme
MPGYGLKGPEEGSGLLPWSWAEERLRTSRNYWLSTVWPDGRPHTMPVWAVWHEGCVWFTSGKGSRKTRNLAADPRCTLATDDPANPVVVEGRAELVSDPADMKLMLELENQKYGTDYGAEMVDPKFNSTFCVHPHWVFGLGSDDFTGSPTRWTFASPAGG